MCIRDRYEGQHGEENISDRGKAFGFKTMTINGNDPLESYIKIKESMDYIRKKQKPVLMEAMVSRLRGHSSATGANLVDEEDCLVNFEKLLLKENYLTDKKAKNMRDDFEKEARQAQEKVREEVAPSADSIWDNVYVDNENADWRAF